MKQLFRTLFWLIPIIALFWGIGFLIADDQKLEFTDPAFEQAIRTELQLEEEAIRKDMLNRIESLSLVNSGITSLEGIQVFESLVSLDVSGNHLSDLQPLERMNRLESLSLTDNQINHLDSLSTLQSLTSLDLRGNQVTTLEPIFGLTNLVSLNIRENHIQDLEPLRDMVLLRDLNARYNKIETVEVLTHLPELRERLYLEGNPITDWLVLSPVYDQIKDKDFSRPEYQLVFSEKGGLYDSALTVSIKTSAEADGVIRFTTDGAEPDESSPIYTEPLSIEESTVVRARFFAHGIEKSAEVTHSYLVGVDTTLPVVSISTAPENLFDREKGIYVPGVYYNPDAPNPDHTGNFAQSGIEWERPIHMEFFEEDGELALSQGAGIRMHGGASRTVDRKSFRLYARSDYGENRFRYPFFEGDTRSEYNRLLLRNSGNDYNNTLFRDAMLQQLIHDFDVETQLYRPTTLYVNGEYWGIYNLRERYDAHYYEIKHGVDPANLDFLENQAVVVEGTNDDYLALLAYMEENGASSPEHYEFISSQIDINNFIDYQIAQIFVRNTDWPGNNIRYWRERPDGKWRWSVFDLDFGFDLPNAAGTVAHDTLAFATATGGTAWPNPDWSTFMLRTLLENENFNEAFINRFAHYLNTNFDSTHIVQTINEMAAVIEPEMQQHINRWQAPRSKEKWEEEVDTLRQFAELRPGIIQGHLLSHLGLRGLADLSIESVQENVEWSIAGRSASELSQGWTGSYFTDTKVPFIFKTEEPVQIESSDLEIVTVTEEGELLFLEEGTASIRFSDSTNILLELTVTVSHIDQESITLEPGQTVSFTHEQAVRWETTDDDIVSVQENGTVSANDVGTVIITGHAQDGTVVKVANVSSVAFARAQAYFNADSPIFFYEGLWEESTLADHREGFARFSSQQGASVTFTFEGTGFRWLGYRGRTQGIADVLIDGNPVAEVDTHSQEPVFQDVLYEVNDLPHGEHTVTILTTGTQRPEAENHRIHLDGVQIIQE